MKYPFLRACGVLLFCGIAGTSVKAQPVQNPANGHWYENVLVPGEITWHEARLAAEQRAPNGMKSYLATITSAQEQDFLVRAFGGFRYEHWLGGYKIDGGPTDTGWRWVTGEPWRGAFWDPGEPNGLNGGEGALEMYGGGSGGKRAGVWNDDKPERTDVGYIVEYEQIRDDAPPSVEIEAPLNESRHQSLTNAVITADDGEGSGVALSNVSVLLMRYARPGITEGYWDGSGWSPTRTPACLRPATPYGTRWNFQFPDAAAGFVPAMYSLQAFARDRADNVGDSDAIEFTVVATQVAPPPVFTRPPVDEKPEAPRPVEPPLQKLEPTAAPILLHRAMSPLNIASARRGQDSVFLNFSGTLDADRASLAKHYTVNVNGEPVAVSGASSLLGGVVLNLPAGTLRPDASVAVTYSNLRDARGQNVEGKTELPAQR